MKRLNNLLGIVVIAASVLTSSCGGASTQEPAGGSTPTPQTSDLKLEDIPLTKPLDANAVAEGKKIYELKCQACHKLTSEKLVGPGWQGVTQRRKPGWIVAMATNPDQMLDKDPDAQKLLEQLLVRMPNQNLSKEDALKVLAFMRSNDGEK